MARESHIIGSGLSKLRPLASYTFPIAFFSFRQASPKTVSVGKATIPPFFSVLMIFSVSIFEKRIVFITLLYVLWKVKTPRSCIIMNVKRQINNKDKENKYPCR